MRGAEGAGQWVLTIAQARRKRHSQMSHFTLPDLHVAALRVCMYSFCVCFHIEFRMHETISDQIYSPNTDPERITELPRCCNLLFIICRMRACHICEFEQQCGCHVDVATLERMACSMHVRWCYDNICCLCGSPAFCILIVHPVHPV